ncbi:MAG: tetratricopeptide repeat protein [Planctomycetota bacterium]
MQHRVATSIVQPQPHAGVARHSGGLTRGRATGIAAGLACVAIAAAGCSTVTSQAKNSQGVRLFQQGAYPQAAAEFQKAIAANPDSADGYYNLAASLHKTGAIHNRPADLQQAEVLYNQCLERNPDHLECYRGLAVLLTETSRRDAAFRLLNNWDRASPANPDPKIELARLLEESGQPEQAKAQLVAALTADPNNARAFTALGRLRDQSGEYQQALADYQRSLQLNRFQPDVTARVAALNAALGGAATGVPPVQPPGRMANQWRPSVRY